LNRLQNIIFAGTELENKRTVSALPKKILKVFGVDKTIEDLRGNRLSVPKRYINLLPPSVPFLQQLKRYLYTLKQVRLIVYMNNCDQEMSIQQR